MAARRATAWLYEFIRFGIKQAWACMFGGVMVTLMIATHFWYPAGLPLARYDFLFLCTLGLQVVLLAARLETFEEAKVILLYHLVGTAMELFKTSVGSWIYPEPSFFRIGGVPLFTGFMYAAVGSFIARVWRLCDFRFSHHPPIWATMALAVAIYVNFFAHHFVADMRLALFGATALVFGRTIIWFRVWKEHRPMPLLAAAGLTALFVWIAENIGTLTKTWIYPHQVKAWSLVGFGKLGAWFLLLVISYAMVAMVAKPAVWRGPARAPEGAKTA